MLLDRYERGTVVDASADARHLGVRVGMSRVQARACAPEAEVLIDDPVRRAARWAAALAVLDAVSPIVENACDGRAYLDMRGIPGDPARHFRRAREAIASLALPTPTLSCAANPFAAYAAGRTGTDVLCTPGR